MADRHTLIRALEKSGMRPEVAEEVGTEIYDAIHDNVATKQDLERVGAALRADLQRSEADLRADLQRIEATLRTDLRELEQRANLRFAV